MTELISVKDDLPKPFTLVWVTVAYLPGKYIGWVDADYSWYLKELPAVFTNLVTHWCERKEK
jgi:hypothetical protein